MLIFAAVLALILSNSPFAFIYNAFLSSPITIRIGTLLIDKPLLLWINDGLMALFFFLIGLEIKRELLIGELSSRKKAMLPIVAAAGGIIVPALLYLLFNYQDPLTIKGWGIPMATDIAFALGVLSLLGTKAPTGLKILLLSLAIIDDVASILIIAIFYTEDLSLLSLSLGSAGLLVAFIFNRLKIVRFAPYVLIGIFIWVCFLKSGIHATLAGAMLAFTIPLNSKDKNSSPLYELERILHPWVAYFIMPIFAFANAGVSLQGLSVQILFNSIPLGIFTGLFLGKQIGVFSFIYLSVKLGICRLPKGINWIDIYAMALLTGIGFTMSLFIGSLAFNDPIIETQIRISVLAASTLSAVGGYFFLRLVGGKKIEL